MESFVNEVNFFEGNNPEDIVAKYGTPVYVYNERILRKRIRNVAGVVKKFPYKANFSMKANSNLTILKIVLEEGLNADAMSIGGYDEEPVVILKETGKITDITSFVDNGTGDEINTWNLS